MDLYHLETFVRVAQGLTFTRAGEERSLSQSAVSRHIDALEKEVGMKLLVRSGRGTALTEAGTRLLEYAERLLHLSQEALRALAELRDLESGQLTVGASTTAGHYVLGPAVAIYQDRYPGIQLRLEVRDSQSILRMVEAGLVDVAVLPEFPAQAGVATEPYMTDELLLVAAPDHPLAPLPEVGLSDLANLPLFVRESGSNTRQTAEALLDARHIPVRKRVLASTEGIKQAVYTGSGLAFCSKYAVRLELQQGLLVALTGPDFPITRQFVFAYPKGGRRPPAALAFVALVRKMQPALETGPTGVEAQRFTTLRPKEAKHP